MPIFKVTATQEVRETYTFYVDAPTAEEAETYIAGLPSLGDVPGAIGQGDEDTGGEVEVVGELESAPEHVRVLTAAWNGGIAVMPRHAKPVAKS